MEIIKKGDIVTVLIPVKNNGALVATNVEVSVVLPLGVSFDSYTSTMGTYSHTTNKWSITELLNGQSALLSLKIKVDDVCNNPYVVSWSVTADQTDNILSNNNNSYSFGDFTCCEVKDCGRYYTKEAWVDTDSGNDSTAALGSPEKPFKTLEEALVNINLEASKDNWTIHISGELVSVNVSTIASGTVFDFNNALVSDLAITNITGNMLYIKGLLRRTTVGSIMSIDVASSDKVVLDNTILITQGVSLPISDVNVINVINIGGVSNSVGGYTNTTFLNEPLTIINTLK